MMRIIGLTGPTGSGKGAVSAVLQEEYNAFIIDTDKIAHDIILKGNAAYYELVEHFGEQILGADGEIIRRRLGDIVFSKKGAQLKFLNECTHRHIYNSIENELVLHSGEDILVIDAPLLIEGEFIKLCKEVWVVFADDSTRAKRIMARDNITYKQAKERMNSQKSYKEYNKFADVIIDNNYDISNLKKQIKDILMGENNEKQKTV